MRCEARARNGGEYFRLSKLWCICTASASTGTLNYRKVNLSGGLAIVEFSSSIIKLFLLEDERGMLAEGNAGVRRDGKPNSLCRNKTCRTYNHVLANENVHVFRQPWHFLHTRNNTGENFSSFSGVDSVTINARSILACAS